MIGGNFSHYRVLKSLGRGGMGEVYLCEDIRLGRRVALKVLLPEFAQDAANLERFVREARAAARISHPRVVSVYEVGEHDGIRFLAMEYIEGTTLREVVARGAVDLRTAVRIGRQLAEGLEAAHSAGIVHRDIKPSNIMLMASGHIKVLDFGIARHGSLRLGAAAGQEDITRTEITLPGQIIGTVAYMSPEQLRGQDVDARSDIFSSGVVLYEVLAGRRPFAGPNSMDIAQHILSSSPQPLVVADTSIAPAIERIILKCLEKDPDWRYQSAQELAIDLRGVERDLNSGTGSAVVSSTASLPAKKSIRPWLLAGAILLLGAILAVILVSRVRSPLPSIAVLPFDCAEPELEYIAEGLSESIQRSLSRVPGLKVRARSLVEQYDGPNAMKAARDLEVAAVLLGSVSARGAEIVVNLELIDGNDGAQIWIERYTRPRNQLLNLEDEILLDVISQFKRRLDAGPRPVNVRATSPEAYELYLKGRYHLNRRSAGDLKQAVVLFQQALAKEPGFALAHARVADAYSLMANFGHQPPRTILPQAKAAARRALELDPNIAEAHASYAFAVAVGDFDWPTAERSFRRALDIEPDSADAHAWYSVILLTPLRRSEEAMIEMQRSMELEPNEPIRRLSFVTTLYMARRFEEALTQARGVDGAYLVPARRAMEGLCLAALGRFTEALSVLQSSAPVSGSDQSTLFLRSALGYIYALNGQTEMAENIAAELENQAAHDYVSPCSRATIHIALGRTARAIELIDECYEVRDVSFRFLNVDPRFDGIRNHSRVEDLLSKAGLR